MDHDQAIAMLQVITMAFDRHDLDGILAHFADDAVFEGPRGPDQWGQRFTGKDAIREAFAARFTGIPDVQYRDDEHFVRVELPNCLRGCLKPAWTRRTNAGRSAAAIAGAANGSRRRTTESTFGGG